MGVRAVTFDFWDTLLVDDSDEPKRAAAGLDSKAEARRKIFVGAVRAAHPALTEWRVGQAWDDALTWSQRRWREDCVTPTLEERLRIGLASLDLTELRDADRVIEAVAHLEVAVPPDPVAGAGACLEALRGRVRIGIVSDATTTPGRKLREILASHGWLDHFDHTAFSDEVGHAKPSPRIFEAACRGLGVTPAELVHVGDRETHDVLGARRAGATAILFTGAVDRSPARTEADAVLADLAAVARWVLERADR